MFTRGVKTAGKLPLIFIVNEADCSPPNAKFETSMCVRYVATTLKTPTVRLAVNSPKRTTSSR
jgi:hypothetical protein